MASAAQLAWELQYQISPIMLTHGVASNFPGEVLPILAITDNALFTSLAAIQTSGVDHNSYFAVYQPLPNSTLINNEYGTYPFANQQVAANATVVQPLQLSMLMTCPVRQPAGYQRRMAVMSALQQTLALHCRTGGTFAVSTPNFLYTEMLLLKLADVSRTDTKQPQMAYQWDFFKPLVTLEDVAVVQNTLMNSMTLGLPNNGTWAGDLAAIPPFGTTPVYPLTAPMTPIPGQPATQ